MLGYALFAFFVGAAVASFTGLLASRLGTGRPVIAGRSSCDACGKRISPTALVPILGFAVSRGRCELCGVRLSPLYPLTEALLGAVFLGLYLAYGVSLLSLVLALLSAVTLYLVLYDLAHRVLPLPGLGLAVLLGLVAFALRYGAEGDALIPLLVAIVGPGAIAAFWFFSKGRAMGGGDAPLALALALATALPGSFLGTLYAFWTGAVVGLVFLAIREKRFRMGVAIPFAPFIACGYLIANFFPGLAAFALPLS